MANCEGLQIRCEGPRRNPRVIMSCMLLKTTRRLTFDILQQHPDTIYAGDDDGPYYRFEASNGYQVISRSRVDIQTERLWLLGAKWKTDPRSGSMVFSSDDRRDAAHDAFVQALGEFAASHGGIVYIRGRQHWQQVGARSSRP